MLLPLVTPTSCTCGMRLSSGSRGLFFRRGYLMRDASNSEEWKRIAEQIANEADSEKLALLVKELCDAFDLDRKQTRQGRLD